MRRLFFVAGLFLLGLSSGVSASDEVEERAVDVDLSSYYELIYQIKVVATNAGSKESIGSGFQISADGLIITNYHVVSGAISSPRTHQIEYLDQSGRTGLLELLDFDVVHDLAVLRHPQPPQRYFQINSQPVRKGDAIYALGNPHDLGITLKYGAYNGMVEHSYNEQILFSGSLNPGMSGGPGLLNDGRVVGVNVATAGSDLSFLVPAAQVLLLVEAGRALSPNDYVAEIADQVTRWQRDRFDDLLARDWSATEFGDYLALGELRKDMQCWGSSNEDEDDLVVEDITKSCNAGNRLYLGEGLSTGQIHYSFAQRVSQELSPLRFHQLLSHGMHPDNYADETQVSNFECTSRFVELANTLDVDARSGAKLSSTKAHLCVRAYIDLPELYDVLFLAERSTDDEAFNVHFTLAGVPQAQAEAFAAKFLHSIGWSSGDSAPSDFELSELSPELPGH